MNPREIKVAVVVIAIIGAAALYLSQRKSSLGKPGLVLEAQSLTNQHGVVVATNRIALPSNIPGYKDELMSITVHEVNVLPKDTTFGRRLYVESDKFSIQVSAILMGADRTSIHKPYYCITGLGWTIEKSEVVDIPMTRPKPYTLKAQLVTASAPNRPDIKGLYMYWFVSDTQMTPRENELWWLLSRDLVTTGILQRWGYISYFGYGPAGQEQIVLQRMKRLVAESVPAFQIPPGEYPVQTALRSPGPETALLAESGSLQ